MNRPDRALVALASVQVAAALVHGLVHRTVPVPIPAWQAAAAIAVLVLAPVAGAAALLAGQRSAGRLTLLVAGTAALAFEGLLHFAVRNPDHVLAVDHGAALFAGTAAVSTASDAVLALAAAWLLWRQAQGSASSSSIASIR